MIVARKQSVTEEDLLLGSEQGCLIFISGAGDSLLQTPAPANGWTHDLLDAATLNAALNGEMWNAYLNGKWIGSSEV